MQFQTIWCKLLICKTKGSSTDPRGTPVVTFNILYCLFQNKNCFRMTQIICMSLFLLYSSHVGSYLADRLFHSNLKIYFIKLLQQINNLWSPFRRISFAFSIGSGIILLIVPRYYGESLTLFFVFSLCSFRARLFSLELDGPVCLDSPISEAKENYVLY